MAIDILNDRSMNSLKDSHVNTVRNATVRSNADTNTASGNTALTDAVDFTSSAQSLSRGFSVATASDGIDENKVAKLKAAINDGSYQIDYDKLADKILSSESELNSALG
ncbi:MAG TPA: flagellar biosynthesis anti-sigma factor FlgM [Succinivibrionaceae bacterium]|nr:flagellar biosynthesis anti-sigma factor FlgM [Succinivibrionaceae bacterium]